MKRSVKEIVVRMIILFVGLCSAHFGVTLFLLADLGSDPFNVFVLIGFLLGGKFGIGTIVCAAFVGMVAERFLPMNEKIIDGLIGAVCCTAAGEKARSW